MNLAEAFKVLSQLAGQVPLNEADHEVRINAKSTIAQALIEFETLKSHTAKNEVVQQPQD